MSLDGAYIQLLYEIREEMNLCPRAEENHDGPVNLRVKDERLALIDRAAEIRGVTRTEFVLRASEEAAIETLTSAPSSRSTMKRTMPFSQCWMRPPNRTSA